jgi:hypothetical protein
MNSQRTFQALATALMVCACLAAPLRGQQTTGTTPDDAASSQTTSNQTSPDGRQMPLPAVRGLFVDSDTQPADSVAPAPDTHSLTGGEAIGMGDLKQPRDVLDFAAHAGETADTGIIPGQVTSVSQLGGALNFDRTWDRFHTGIVYDGAALVYDPNPFYNQQSYQQNQQPYQQSHTLGVSQDFEWARWIVRLRDDFVVSPQATFGGLDTGGFGSDQIGLLSTILPALAPSETILTGRVMRLNEAGLGEVDYRLSRRAELTFAAGYGALHFLNSGYIDSYETNGRVGYNYALDPKDMIGVVYDYTLVGYKGFAERVGGNLAQVIFGRRVLGRLAFEVAAGPQQLQFENYNSTVRSEWAVSAYALVTYTQRRTNYSVAFSRGLVGGEGVLLGAYGDLVTANVTRQLSRTWSVGASGGFARNNNVTAAAGQPSTNLFSNYYGNANLTHDLSRHLVLALTYGLQKQNTSGVCPVANCGLIGLRQVGGVVLDWHTQKLALN